MGLKVERLIIASTSSLLQSDVESLGRFIDNQFLPVVDEWLQQEAAAAVQSQIKTLGFRCSVGFSDQWQGRDEWRSDEAIRWWTRISDRHEPRDPSTVSLCLSLKQSSSRECKSSRIFVLLPRWRCRTCRQQLEPAGCRNTWGVWLSQWNHIRQLHHVTCFSEAPPKPPSFDLQLTDFNLKLCF